MIIIGSHGLSFRTELNRSCKDFDLICSYDAFDRWIKQQNDITACYPIERGKKMIVKSKHDIYEFEIAWENSTAHELSKLVYNDKDSQQRYFHNFGLVTVPSVHVLYALKQSHKYLKNNPFFLKTMRDLQLMEKEGAAIPTEYLEWYKKREQETYNYSHPNLNQNKNNFFDLNQGVTYIYDHDTIHIAMAHLDKPAYEYYKDDTKEVFCSKKSFYAASEEVRLYGVLEEAYVLALERSQIPFKGKVDPKRSFDIALEKVCTSITSGWFRAYAYKNYDKVMSLYNPNYVNKFWEAVAKGVVKKL